MFKIHNIYGGIVIKYLYKLIVGNKIPTLASSIAFNIILNGGSFLFLYLIFSRYFNNSFINQIINNLGDGDFKDLIVYFIDYQNNISYSFFLIITSIYSASSLYYHFINVIELLTNRSIKINISRRIISIILTILFLLGINIITMLIVELIRNINLNLRAGIILLIILLIVGILYFINFISVRDKSFKKMYRGLIFSMLYILLFTIGFIVYLNIFSNFKVIYGVLSFIFIFCFYIYFISIGILIGVCINVKNNLII